MLDSYVMHVSTAYSFMRYEMNTVLIQMSYINLKMHNMIISAANSDLEIDIDTRLNVHIKWTLNASRYEGWTILKILGLIFDKTRSDWGSKDRIVKTPDPIERSYKSILSLHKIGLTNFCKRGRTIFLNSELVQ